jgi:hypothetical protein
MMSADISAVQTAGTGAIEQVREEAARTTYAEEDQAILLGLYHGYDQARIALAKVVARYGAEAPSNEETRRRIWSRARREGRNADLFDPPSEIAHTDGLSEGAHSAALSAFATISHQADELLETLRERWPHLAEDAGGPLPAPTPSWDD